jgi:5-methyltetrahydropteroyltriglutamate--homocysteine methyltransferase
MSAMSAPPSPPFRAEHVGSLLRPAALRQAREQLLGPHTAEANLGPHDNAELRALEDAAIRDAVALQERLGLRAVTDGELRRRSWILELILSWEGFAANRVGSAPVKWRDAGGEVEGMSEFTVTKPIRWRPGAVLRGFEFLKANCTALPKVGLPAPDVIHYFMGGREKITKSVYRDEDAFWDDLIAAYRAELKALVAAGARYIQLDDTSFAFLCDDAHRGYVRSRGEDPDALAHTYADKINATIAELPDGVTVAVHQCRGNREGHWAAEGGYEPIADILLNRLDVDAYFLEYDTARAGGFAPLRLLPKGKVAVLGLVSSKTPALEPRDTLLRRIEDAARFAPIEQLALSPQCGFASSYRGNPLTVEEQEAKLRLVAETAERVWGAP